MAAGQLWSEAMFALDAATGRRLWSFQPAALQPTQSEKLAAAWADDDFGSSPNLITTQGGTTLDGEGQKSAWYWARDAATGEAAWSQLVGQPGNLSSGSPAQGGNAIGGFIGSTAVETDAAGRALRIVGATAFPVPDPSDPASVDRSTWAVRALNPSDGTILWTDRLGGPAYGATSLVDGIAFVPDTFADALLAVDAASGMTLAAVPLGGPPSSTPVVAEDGLFLGTGTGQQGPNGEDILAGTGAIWAFALGAA
jgi:outer membrane protein assembly factor BamB